MNNEILWLCYGIVFGVKVFFPELNLYMYSTVIFLNIIALMTSGKNKETVLISSFMLSELFCIVNIIVYFIYYSLTKKIVIKPMKKIQVAAIAIILSNSLICAIMYDTLPNVVFSALYFVLLWLTWTLCKGTFSIENVTILIRKTASLQIFVTICIALKNRSLAAGDIFGGTIGNAHLIALMCIVELLTLFCIQRKFYHLGLAKAIAKEWKTYVKLLCVIYFASANAVTIALATSLIVYLVLHTLTKGKRDLLFLVFGTYLVILFAIWVLNLDSVRSWLGSSSKFLNLYIYTSGWNGKYLYFKGTLLDSLKGIRLFIGYGIGQYGSRFANAFAYSEMYRADSGINNFISSVFEPHFTQQYAQYISFYTDSFVDGISWRSAIVSYPFSSAIALIAEMGVVGVALFVFFIQDIADDSIAKIVIYFFFIACIFDIYFDDYQCIGIVIAMIAGTICVKENKKNIVPDVNSEQKNSYRVNGSK